MSALGLNLDPEELKRNLAITLGTRPAVLPEHLGLPAGPEMAAPAIAMPQGKQPDLSIMAAKPPAVSSTGGKMTGPFAPKGTLEGDKQERQRLQDTGSGISQISRMVQGSGLGQAHPLAGKILGGLAQTGATIGDIALNTLGGGIGQLAAQQIPGTQEHHDVLMHQANRQIGSEEAEQEHEAQTARENAATEAIQNPADKYAPIATDQGYAAFDPKTGKATPVTDASGATLQAPDKSPIQHAVLPDGSVVAITRGKDGTVSADEVFKGDGKTQPKVASLEIGGEQHSVLVDEQTGNVIKDLGKTGQKAPVVNVNTQRNADNNRADKSYQYNNGELDKLGNPVSDSVKRLGRLQDTLAQGNMQSDALVAPELLTVMAGGAGSGLRMNEAEIARIVGGRTQWENLKASLQKWSLDPKAARSIMPEQDRQIRALVQAVQGKLLAKQGIISGARQSLIDTDDVKEHRKIVANTNSALNAIDEGKHYEGEKIKLKNGSQVTVKAVHPDGSFDAD